MIGVFILALTSNIFAFLKQEKLSLISSWITVALILLEFAYHATTRITVGL